MALLAMTGLSMALMAARQQRVNQTPDKLPKVAEKMAGYPPKDKNPDPSKFGFASQVRLKTPTVNRPDLKYMTQRGRDYVIGDPLLNRIYKQHIYTHSRDTLGDGRLKDPIFCGNNGRFGPTQLRRIGNFNSGGVKDLSEQTPQNLKDEFQEPN